MSPTSYQTAPPRGEAITIAAHGLDRYRTPRARRRASSGALVEHPRPERRSASLSLSPSLDRLQLDLAVLRLVGLQERHDALDVLLRLSLSCPSGALRIDRSSELPEQHVRRAGRLHGVQPGLPLLRCILGSRRRLLRLRLRLVEETHGSTSRSPASVSQVSLGCVVVGVPERVSAAEDPVLAPDGLPPDGLPPDGLPPDVLPPDTSLGPVREGPVAPELAAAMTRPFVVVPVVAAGAADDERDEALFPLRVRVDPAPPRSVSARWVAFCAAATSSAYPASVPALRSAWAVAKSEAASASRARASATSGGAVRGVGDDEEAALGVVVRIPPVLVRLVPSSEFNAAPSVRLILTCWPSTAMTYLSCGCGMV